MVTLDTPLKNGDIGNNDPKEQPSKFGLVEFCAYVRAKNRIRQWYKRSRWKKNIARGRDLLKRNWAKVV